MKGIVLYCIVLYCIVLYCIVLYCIVLAQLNNNGTEQILFYRISLHEERALSDNLVAFLELCDYLLWYCPRSLMFPIFFVTIF